MEGNNVRVTEATGGLGLTGELQVRLTFSPARVGSYGEEFQRDRLAEQGILRQVDTAGGARAQGLTHPETVAQETGRAHNLAHRRRSRPNIGGVERCDGLHRIR